MASYLEIHNRKRRHSQAIIERNNMRRQELLLKEQLLEKQERPDIEDTSEESPDEEVPAEDRVYWRSHQSSGYHPSLQWMRGEQGRYYYDGREGSRTFGTSDGGEDVFLNDAERDNVLQQLSSLSPDPISPVSASRIYNDALTGNTGSGSSLSNYINSLSERYIDTDEVIRTANNIREGYASQLREQGIYTTDYVNRTALEEGESSEEELGVGRPVEAVEEVVEEDPVEERPNDPWAQLIPDMSVEEYESLSNWGKQSLGTESPIRSNMRLWQETPSVVIVDPGDAKYAESYNRVGKTIRESSDRVGTPLRATSSGRRGVNWVTAIPRGKFVAANGAIAAHNQRVRNGTLLEGEDNELLKEAVGLSFKDWIIERDKTFQLQLGRAKRNQEKNVAEYGSYFHPRITDFSTKGHDVIGIPNQSWVGKFGQDVKERNEGIRKMLAVPIPRDIALLPPASIDADLSDLSVYRRTQSPTTLGNLLQQWYNYNLRILEKRDPITHVNEAQGDWGHNQTQNIVESVSRGRSTNSTIVSIDENMEIGAALNFSNYGDTWSINTAGANLKNFSSYPYQSIDTALNLLIKTTRRDASLEIQGRPAHQYWRTVRRFWQRFGKPHPSASARETSQRRHGQWVFQAFARKFITEGGTSASTAGLTSYVTEKYKEYGFVGGHDASRLNILWTLAFFSPDWVPRDNEGNVIEKSFVAYPEIRDTIIKDTRLDNLQTMLNNLVMKNNKPSLSKEQLAQWDESQEEEQMQWLGMNEEEYAEFIQSFNYMLSETGPSDSKESE